MLHSPTIYTTQRAVVDLFECFKIVMDFVTVAPLKYRLNVICCDAEVTEIAVSVVVIYASIVILNAKCRHSYLFKFWNLIYEVGENTFAKPTCAVWRIKVDFTTTLLHCFPSNRFRTGATYERNTSAVQNTANGRGTGRRTVFISKLNRIRCYRLTGFRKRPMRSGRETNGRKVGERIRPNWFGAENC